MHYLTRFSTTRLTVGTLLLAIGIALSAPRALAQRTPIPSPTATAKSEDKKRCCFCVVADPGQRNAADQKQYCEQCLMNKSANSEVQACDTLQTIVASQFTGADPNICSGNVLAYNLEHGPILKKTFERLKKCVARLPTCNSTLVDLSCSSFGDPDQVKEEVTALQAMLGPNQTVTVCGNVSDNYTKGCNEFMSARKQLIITSTTVDEPIQPCPKANTYCAPPKVVHRCKAEDGSVQRQRCCAKVGVVDGSEQQLGYGVWSNPGSYCTGSPSCPPGCDKRTSCVNKDTSSLQECIKIEGGDYTCFKDTDYCAIGGRTCDQRSGACSLPPAPTATASPSPAGATQSASPKSSRTKRAERGEGMVFIQLDRAGRSFGIDQALLKVAAEPRNLLGDSSVATITGTLGFGGVLLRNVDPASTLGLLRFMPNDIIHFVNDTAVSDVNELSATLRAAKSRTTITFSRGAGRWVVTVMVRDAA